MRHKWTPLTREQPTTLSEIIRYSKSHANLVPKPSVLAENLEISEIAARGRIVRLRQYFVKRGNIFEVDVKRLCTEKESALFFLTVQQMSNESKDGRVFKSSLFENLKCRFENFFANWSDIDFLWFKGIETDYLVQVTPECVRPGTLIEYQFEYLEIIAS